jgi:hypothetical protein
MIDDKLHLSVLRRSRKPLLAGDLFAMLVKKRGYLFGRVILPSMPEGHIFGSSCCMIYIYSPVSAEMSIRVEDVGSQALLLPPIFTNRRPWTMGYFQTLGNFPLSSADVLSQHCFYDLAFDTYVDELRRPLREKSDPCGMFGVDSYASISSAVGKALGLPTLESREDY